MPLTFNTVLLLAVRLAFDRSQVDFCRLTREGLRRVVALPAKKASSWGTPREVVESLAKKAKLWGTPPDIIEYHKNCMERVFAMLK